MEHVLASWQTTLMLYAMLLHVYAVAGVCHTEYDMKLTCHDCCYGTQLSTFNNIKSAIACSGLCAKNIQCRSFQYDSSKKECWTNGEKMTTINTSCSNRIRYGEITLGSCRPRRMFEPCSGDGDCVIANSACFNEKCDCNDGHPYDFRTDSCLTSCTKYGDTFREVSYYIAGYNTAQYHGTSTQRCMEHCIAATNPVCLLIEYEGDGEVCALSKHNALNAIPSQVTASDWKQWDRNCA